jgi:hypothetical protein
VRLGALANLIYREFAFGPGHGLDFSAVVNEIRDLSTVMGA